MTILLPRVVLIKLWEECKDAKIKNKKLKIKYRLSSFSIGNFPLILLLKYIPFQVRCQGICGRQSRIMQIVFVLEADFAAELFLCVFRSTRVRVPDTQESLLMRH